MSLEIQTVSYGDNNVYRAYVAYPQGAKLPLPSVVVLQEAWGLDEHIEDVTRRFAEAGYVALAPDLYARNGARPEALTRPRVAELLAFLNELPPGKMLDPETQKAALAKKSAEQVARIQETQPQIWANVQKPEHVDTVLASIAFLRDSYAPSKGQKVATIGFCMGGGLSAKAASRDPKLALAVMLYGRGLDEAEAANVVCPIVAFNGKKDEHIMGGVPAFEAAMKKANKKFRSVVYENAGHAFFNDTRPSYDVDATRDAFAQILAEFRANLV